MTDRNKSEIAIVLDRSGSMVIIREDMLGGFASFIEDRKKDAVQVHVSLYQFDDKHETVYEGLHVRAVPPLALVPRGSTALFDAVGRTINRLGSRLSAMPEHERPAAVVVMIITDGMENASVEFTAERVSAMIRHQEEKYLWKFLYLGADARAFQESASLGVAAVRSAKYQANAVGSNALYAASSRSVGDYFNQVQHGVVGADLVLNAQDGLVVNPDATGAVPPVQPIITTK